MDSQLPQTDQPQLDRRSLLIGASTAAAGVAFAVGGAAPANAQAAGQIGQQVMTIVYQNKPGVRFDFDYYEKTHMPLIMRLYGESISRFELRRGMPGADGAAPPYVATITIWIADTKAFDEAAAEHQARLLADVPKFTDAVLIAQRDTIVGTAT